MFLKVLSKYVSFALTLANFTAISHVESGELNLNYPDLPKPITSFGAVKLENFLYIYGGHSGKAHSYSVDTTLNSFHRLCLKSPTQWESLPSGVRAQGTSLVAYQGSIYRIGGLTILNEEKVDIDEDDDEPSSASLQSINDFARYQPDNNEWHQLPPLPEPRSSHDSVVVGHHLYVLGGWNLAGNTETGQWFDTMFVADLSAEKINWVSVPQPFRRRAIAVSAHNGQIFAIGGMDSEGDTSNKVHIFNVSEENWRQGPSLPNGPMKGFGAAACTTGNQLLVSHYAGTLLALSGDQSEWLPLSELKPRRFFHRMVVGSQKSVLIIGGANRVDGHLGSVKKLTWK